MVIAGFKHMVSFGMGRICRGKNKGSKFSSIDQYIYVYPPTPRLFRGGGEKRCEDDA